MQARALALLTAERVRRFSVVILVVNVVLYGVAVARGHFPFDALGTAILPDFIAHLTGGTLASRGGAAWLYDVHEQAAVQLAITGDPQFLDLYLSPPLAALLYVPFTFVPYAVAAALWTATTALLLAASARVLRALMPSVTRAQASLLFLAALASQPVIQLLGSGQDTGMTLLLWSAGVALALARRDVAAGLVLSLGLLKPQLFVLPPLVFLVLRRWRALGAWASGAALQLAATVVIFGAPALRAWWVLLHSPEYVSFLRGQRGVRMSSVVPLFESVVPESWRSGAGFVGGALSAGLVVWALVRMARAVRRGQLDERGVWALACVTTLLATPHLFDYDLTLLVVPVALLLEVAVSRGGSGLSSATKWTLLAIYLLTWTVAARAGLESSRWPLRALAASWTAVPLLYLWRRIPLETTRREA